ncbi:MAG TPA: TRAP transporter substrate-binding protein DctP, partial [Candidatus Omnitrophota bacterium]|nr:TRAP transporter substrate-binding protein DctP [Candidatus Omnitrophota bacterium]
WVAGAFGSTGRCLVTPADAKGLRVRPSGAGFADLWRAAGAEPVSDLGSDALPTLLGSNLIQGVDTSTSSMLSYRLYESLRCVTAPDGASLWFLYEPVLVSKKSFDKLDEPRRKALLAAGRRAEADFFATSRDIDAAMVKAFADHGVTVVTLTPAQAKAWTGLARSSSWRAFADRVPGGKDLLERLRSID